MANRGAPAPLGLFFGAEVHMLNELSKQMCGRTKDMLPNISPTIKENKEIEEFLHDTARNKCSKEVGEVKNKSDRRWWCRGSELNARPGNLEHTFMYRMPHGTVWGNSGARANQLSGAGVQTTKTVEQNVTNYDRQRGCTTKVENVDYFVPEGEGSGDLRRLQGAKNAGW